MNISADWFVPGFLLTLLQVVLAIPWLLASGLIQSPRKGGIGAILPPLFAGLIACVVLPISIVNFLEADVTEGMGQWYAAIAQLQLVLDAFIVGVPILGILWPKGGAVAQAAFREGIRQPMFWLLGGLGFLMMLAAPMVPYFTFGEDDKMVKEIGYDLLMLCGAIFGALAAGFFVSEEIEGRTAVTLLSKPVSRRQFLIGKFVGIILAALLMISVLGTWFEVTIFLKRHIERMDPLPAVEWLTALTTAGKIPTSALGLLRGISLWLTILYEVGPGVILSGWQITLLTAIAVSLATRLPVTVNMPVVLSIYLMAHLTPVLVKIGANARATNPNNPVSTLLEFTGKVFDTILPSLEFFRVGPALIGDAPPAPGPFLVYIGMVSLYGIMYTTVALLLGLILFEDRDLA
jgi:ABC-type transport system involved in multi-copper enzyme maturation permease subunit